MPLLDDARALLEIDRERVRLARETAQIALEHSEVLADAEDRAARLAALGERERPKTLAFLAEAVGFLPSPGQGAPGASTTPPLSSSGGGGGGGSAGGGGGGRLIPGSRTLVSQRGGIRQSEDFVREHCALIPGGVEIPNPRNPFALLHGDMVNVPAWDCSGALGVPDAVFLDPDAMQALLPAQRSSSSAGGGGGSGGGGGGARTQNDPRVPLRRPGATDPRVPVSGSSTADPLAPSTGSSTVSADGRLIARTLKEEIGTLRQEIRAGGDLGLQIRRNGGL